MRDFVMPALGADMETGKVVQWLVRPGDRVKRGDVVAVVETHKGAIDVEIFLDGLIEDLAPPGTELPVGAVLAHVREEGTAAAGAGSLVPARPRASPAARQRAQALGLDIDQLHGTGDEGAVTLADVERAAATPAAAPAAAAAPPRFDPSSMRRAIAVAMGRSKREIPHYYLTRAIDCGAAVAWLDAYNREHAPADRLLAAALLLKAAALALREVPQLNGFYEHEAFRPGAGIHPGWAIALRGGGLVAPAIHDADRASLPALMAAMRELVERARTGRLRSSEIADPTVTVTSLGERGADAVLGVIYPPQVAIVGFGRIVPRPWVVDGRLEARPVLAATLAADHRASDGHVGGLLLAAIDRALQDPPALAGAQP
ncbi:dihydrolipoamide acetyltransferase family protein [Ramlibacter sp.]|uniref:dihydrolipoamide acetyltransferase family protein n=1 Tax=Ramlibacter sp. TaxID=1917967 RepID=UPI002CD4DAE2|nr:dihydrolipoamide acetyltransferase family protein [Ramlibacter sp.]HWI83675.1 dihydrolipoamide acetyltransferase family protein [Ramlibacter sp.]